MSWFSYRILLFFKESDSKINHIRSYNMDESTVKAKRIFKDYLRQMNLKVTVEREQILEAVFATHEHFDAEELLMTFKTQKISISRATIYRTLELLIECRLVKKSYFGESQARFEHVFGHDHHDHLICNVCGKIIEFYNVQLEAIQSKICEEYDFKELDHSLRIFGLCKECRSKTEPI